MRFSQFFFCWMFFLNIRVSAQQPVQPVREPVGDVQAALATLRNRETGGGLLVSIGYQDVDSLLAVGATGRWLVQHLDVTADSVNAVRRQAYEKKLTGLVTAEKRADFHRLPFRGRLVNVLVADLDALGGQAPTQAELLRVLIPGKGVALLRKGGTWQRVILPWPDTYGEWTHPYGMANGNLFSRDTAVGVPTGIQWVGTGGHRFSISSLVGDGVVVQNDGFHSGYWRVQARRAGPEVWEKYEKFEPFPYRKFAKQQGDLGVVARDAFNGLPIARMPLFTSVGARQTDVSKRIIADGKLLLMRPSEKVIPYKGIDKKGKEVERRAKTSLMVAYNIHTGKLIRTYDQGLYEVNAGKRNPQSKGMFAAFSGKTLVQAVGEEVVALDLDTGKRLWSFKGTDPYHYGVSISDNGAKVYVAAGKKGMERVRFFGARESRVLIQLDMKTGKKDWEADIPYDQVSQIIPIAAEGKVFINAVSHHGWAADVAYVAAFNMADGKQEWVRGAIRLQNTKTLGALTQEQLVDQLTPRKKIKKGKETYTDASASAMIYKDGNLLMAGSYYLILYRADDGYVTYRPQGNMGCQRGAATPDLTYIASYSFADTVTHEKISYDEVGMQHPDCSGGFVPAHGFWFAESTKFCQCINQMTSQFAMSSDPVPPMVSETARLTKGTDMTPVNIPQVAGLESVGFQSTILPEWDRGAYTTPVFVHGIYHTYEQGWGEALEVDGVTYAAELHAGRMVARRGDTVLWSYQASGRIGDGPLLHDGVLYFGSRDGYLYALDAATGAPKWRFLAARNHDRLVHAGQVESVWPATNPLLHDGLIWVSAGILSTSDGGLCVWGLDPKTGSIEFRSVWYQPSVPNENGKHFFTHGKKQQVFFLNYMGVHDGKPCLEYSHTADFGAQPPSGLRVLSIDRRTMDGQTVTPKTAGPWTNRQFAHFPWMTERDILRNRLTDRSGSSSDLPTSRQALDALNRGQRVRTIVIQNIGKKERIDLMRMVLDAGHTHKRAWINPKGSEQ